MRMPPQVRTCYRPLLWACAIYHHRCHSLLSRLPARTHTCLDIELAHNAVIAACQQRRAGWPQPLHAADVVTVRLKQQHTIIRRAVVTCTGVVNVPQADLRKKATAAAARAGASAQGVSRQTQSVLRYPNKAAAGACCTATSTAPEVTLPDLSAAAMMGLLLLGWKARQLTPWVVSLATSTGRSCSCFSRSAPSTPPLLLAAAQPPAARPAGAAAKA
jgi:hypothetical protein